jgi:hypothetical protein
MVLFVLLAAAYAASIDIRASRGASITGDEPFYLITTQSLIEDGNLDLRDQFATHSYRSFFDHPDGLWQQSMPRGDSQVLSPHNPGLSVLVIPGFVIAGLRGVQVQLLLIAALTFALTYVLVRRLSGEPLLAWLVTLTAGLCATPFIYASEVYPEVPAALLLASSLLLLTRRRPAVAEAMIIAASMVAMLWLGVKYAPLAALVGGYALLRLDGGGRLALLGIAAPSAVIYVWFNLATFEGLTPYGLNLAFAGESTGQLLETHVGLGDRIYRFWGLFIDRRFGIGRWAPFLLLAVPGLLLLVRERGLPRLAGALVLAQTGIAVFAAITMMGWWFPGRTLMTVVPLLVLPITLLLRDLPRLRWPAILLAAWSLAITGALVEAGHAREVVIAVDPFEMEAPWFSAVAGLWPQYTSWTTETWLLTVAWLVAGGAAVAAVTAHVYGLPWRPTAPHREPGTLPHPPVTTADRTARL